jgi:Ca2+/Na+ antiporter
MYVNGAIINSACACMMHIGLSV